MTWPLIILQMNCRNFVFRSMKRKKDIKEKQDAVEDLQNDRKPYPLELKKARQELQRALSDRYGRKIEVHIFADLFDITDEKWKKCDRRTAWQD